MASKRLYLLLSVAVTTMAVLSCNTFSPSDAVTDTLASEDSVQAAASAVNAAPVEDTIQQPVVEEEQPAPKPKKVAKKKAEPKPKTETIYVSTYDRGGQVWGHITMTGNRGKGTIHDADENHYTVTCTRHGNELYAVDQNSRQYVFKL